MALKVTLVAAGVLIGVIGGAALGIHAQDESDMGAGALQTGVDGSDQAASAAGVEPNPTADTPVTQQSYGVWDRLARCESTSNWHVASGNGYFGGLQFDRQTWLAYGGEVYAARADFASREQQIAVAEKVRAARGFRPWPACSRSLGLR